MFCSCFKEIHQHQIDEIVKGYHVRLAFEAVFSKLISSHCCILPKVSCEYRAVFMFKGNYFVLQISVGF